MIAMLNSVVADVAKPVDAARRYIAPLMLSVYRALREDQEERYREHKTSWTVEESAVEEAPEVHTQVHKSINEQ